VAFARRGFALLDALLPPGGLLAAFGQQIGQLAVHIHCKARPGILGKANYRFVSITAESAAATSKSDPHP
jgi:hypothetical protein